MTLEKIKDALENGLLSFPVTDFDEKGNFESLGFAHRVAWFLEHQVSSVFVAGGTGEFFSLTKEEYSRIVEIAVSTVAEKVPVIASAGRSVKEAIEWAGIAEKAGVHALLLFPPYLTECPPEGVYAYAKEILQHTGLPVIYYNRGNGILQAPWVQRLAAECPNLIGLKDGTGNMQDLNDIIKTVGNRLSYIGGVPTAEILAEAYLSVGVNTYSSAAFNFVPELANLFYKSLRQGDKEMVDRITRDFYIPLVRLRNKKSGYAVSLIKAGARIIGKPAGDVRPPLSMAGEADYQELKRLIEVTQQYR